MPEGSKVEEPKEDDLYNVGTIATIKQVLKLPGGTNRILVEGTSRARIKRVLASEPFFSVEAEELLDEDIKTMETEAFMRNVLLQFEEYVRQTKKIPDEALENISSIEEPGKLADIIASHLSQA